MGRRPGETALTPDRRQELLKLYEEQVHWFGEASSASATPSPFFQATNPKQSLTGAEVYFLGRMVEEQHGELHLEGANLANANLGLAYLDGAYLQGASFSGTRLEGALLLRADLRFAYFDEHSHLEGANLWNADFRDATASEAHFEGATFDGAQMERANLIGAHLEDTSLVKAHLEDANLSFAHLEGADLRRAFFNTVTNLDRAVVFDENHGLVSVADVHWQDVNLAVVNEWPEQSMLGDEREAHELEKKPLTDLHGKPVPKNASARGATEVRGAFRLSELQNAWRGATSIPPARQRNARPGHER